MLCVPFMSFLPSINCHEFSLYLYGKIVVFNSLVIISVRDKKLIEFINVVLFHLIQSCTNKRTNFRVYYLAPHHSYYNYAKYELICSVILLLQSLYYFIIHNSCSYWLYNSLSQIFTFKLKTSPLNGFM